MPLNTRNLAWKSYG